MDRDAYFSAELERLRQGVEAGSLSSALEAMAMCAGNGLAWPDWLSAVAIRSTEAAFTGSKAAGAGRFEKDRAHMRRYRAACYWLDMLKRDKAQWKARSGGHPRTMRGAFAAAADMIRPGERHVTADAVRKSYFDVTRAMRAGKADRYLAAETAFPLD